MSVQQKFMTGVTIKVLEPMDSFGTWRKLLLLFFFYAEFYRVVTINALLTVRSEMLQFSGNNQNIKMFGVPPPPPPPNHLAIGYTFT